MINKTFEQTIEAINSERLVLLYISMPNCSVCHAVKPRVEQMFANHDLPMYALDAFEYQEVAGTFQVMTAPAILVFYQGKEVHRQARFINFQQLETLVDNYLAMSEPTSYEAIFDND